MEIFEEIKVINIYQPEYPLMKKVNYVTGTFKDVYLKV